MKKRKRFMSLLICMLYAGLLIEIIPVFSAEGPRGLVLENEFVRIEFEEETLGLSAMIDKASGLNHVQESKSAYALWELMLSAGTQEKELMNDDHPATGARIENMPDGAQRAVLEWKSLDWRREKGALSITVTVDLPKDCGIAEWRIFVENESTFWSLWEVRFPYFTSFLKSQKYDVAQPEWNWGTLYKNCIEVPSASHPGARWPVQFQCASRGNNSVYLAACDPGGRRKSFIFRPGDTYRITNYPENMSIPGNDYPGYYPFRIGVFQGAWIDAAKIYRKWALQQPWTSAGPVSKRTKTPDHLKNLALWILYSDPYEGTRSMDMDDDLLESAKYVDVPLGIHWYNWHHNRFDNEYPHYMPPDPLFKERVKNLQDHNIVTMPYINALILDHDNYDITRFLPFTIKDQLGHPPSTVWWYGSGRTDWGCTHTPFWQNTIATLVDSLAQSYGINAIYLDLLAGATPFLCFDKTHGHPLGGGTWWVDGVKKLISKVRDNGYLGSTPIGITGEHFSEVYMDQMDGYLIWMKRQGTEIPIHAAVYSGYTLFVGSPHRLEYGDRNFIMCQGRDFLWGSQLGWMGTGLYTDSEHKEKAEYMKRLGQYRVAARKFLTYGEFLDMIEPENRIVTLTEYWPDHFGVPQNATLPSAMGALWKAEDGNMGIFMVNFLNKENKFEYSIDPVKYGLPDTGTYTLTQLTPEEDHQADSHPAGSIKRTELLGPREIKVIEVRPVY